MSTASTSASTTSKPYALPPEPPLPMAVQTMFWIQRPTEMMQALLRRYGSAFTIALAPFKIALFSDPESIRTIFAAKHLAVLTLPIANLTGERRGRTAKGTPSESP